MLELTFSDKDLESSGEYLMMCEVRREINLNPNNPRQNKRSISVDKQEHKINASLFFPEGVSTVDKAEESKGFADSLISFIDEDYREGFVEWAMEKIAEAREASGEAVPSPASDAVLAP